MIHSLRYGENPQATAKLIKDNSLPKDPFSIFNLKNPDGSAFDYSAMSYINVSDTDRLLNTLTNIAAGFAKNTGKVPSIAVAVKHGHICGGASGKTPQEATKKVYEGDKRAVFGGFIMCNYIIDKDSVQTMLDTAGGKTFLAGIVAPKITKEAVELVPKQKRKCLLITLPALMECGESSPDKTKKRRQVRGGYLEETETKYIPDFEIIAKDLSDEIKDDLILAWAVGSTSVSNTITLVKNRMVIGNGVGQQDRVGACELAIKRAKDAGHNLDGCVAYSDSFFPFTDGVEILANAGIKTIFATSGSVKDEEVKKFAQDRGINFVTAPDKEARGFFGH